MLGPGERRDVFSHDTDLPQILLSWGGVMGPWEPVPNTCPPSLAA